MHPSFVKVIDKVRCDPDILAVILFGSHAREEATAGSDIDICLVFVPGPRDERGMFNKRLAFMSDFDLDAHIYQQVPLYMRQRVLEEGKVLYCRDEELLYEIACKTITEFADYEHIYRDYLKEIAGG